MGLSLKPQHLKRYKDVAVLLMKYGRSDLVKAAGARELLARFVGAERVSPNGGDFYGGWITSRIVGPSLDLLAPSLELLRVARWPEASESVLVVGHQPTLGLAAALVVAALTMTATGAGVPQLTNHVTRSG